MKGSNQLFRIREVRLYLVVRDFIHPLNGKDAPKKSHMKDVQVLLLTSVGCPDWLPYSKVLMMQARYTATLVWVVSFLFSQTQSESFAMLVAALHVPNSLPKLHVKRGVVGGGRAKIGKL